LVAEHTWQTPVVVLQAGVAPPQFASLEQAAQKPPEQLPLWQSVPDEHPSPLMHAGHVPPPQSTSVSAPSFW